MNPLSLFYSAFGPLARRLLLLGAFCTLVGCVREPTQLVPPHIPPPNKTFVVIRDFQTTWNAALRALDGRRDRAVQTCDKKGKGIVLEPVTVPLEPYCDCGKIGETDLTGEGLRRTVIRFRARAPQETLIEISCSYSKAYRWKDVYGRHVRTETIPCVSNGRFELGLYETIMGFMSR